MIIGSARHFERRFIAGIIGSGKGYGKKDNVNVTERN